MDKECPDGHYCPEGTTWANEFSCPEGTFNPLMGQTNESACEPCTGGMYCMGRGLSTPTTNCRLDTSL